MKFDLQGYSEEKTNFGPPIVTNQIEVVFRRVVSTQTGIPIEKGPLAVQFIVNDGEQEFIVTREYLRRILALAQDAVVGDLPPIEGVDVIL